MHDMTKRKPIHCYGDIGNGRLTVVSVQSAGSKSMISFPSAYLHEVVCTAHGNHALSKQQRSMEWQSGATAVQSLKTEPDKRQ